MNVFLLIADGLFGELFSDDNAVYALQFGVFCRLWPAAVCKGEDLHPEVVQRAHIHQWQYPVSFPAE